MPDNSLPLRKKESHGNKIASNVILKGLWPNKKTIYPCIYYFIIHKCKLSKVIFYSFTQTCIGPDVLLVLPFKYL
jgi:hypothetical protein